MNFKTKEDATVRIISTKLSPNGDTQLRIRSTDGVLFALQINLSEGVKPAELADALVKLGNDIKTIYTNE